MASNQQETKVKITVTIVIWSFATGMLAICIPIVAITHSGVILPLTLILAVSGITCTLLSSPRPQIENSPKSTSNLQELEERIVNLEAICSSNEFEIKKEFKQLDS
ncbi:MAG: hypothetical protein SAL07_22950 [Oscillatoria sp. PMC 1051.18]|nr:hypothetical protein [Oscillatoria sp. PMC 1050.18]MEC5032770.1 hypothetical protein [Oscillatoria sp. PMC 1051.18]